MDVKEQRAAADYLQQLAGVLAMPSAALPHGQSRGAPTTTVHTEASAPGKPHDCGAGDEPARRDGRGLDRGHRA